MHTSALATDQAAALRRLADYARQKGVAPGEFRTHLVYEFSGDIADQVLGCMKSLGNLTDAVSLVSPLRGEALAAAFEQVLIEFDSLYDYLLHLKEHPLDWPAKQ